MKITGDILINPGVKKPFYIGKKFKFQIILFLKRVMTKWEIDLTKNKKQTAQYIFFCYQVKLFLFKLLKKVQWKNAWGLKFVRKIEIRLEQN